MTTKENFLSDVKDHVIEILRDDGVNRHIRFRESSTMCMHFDLITWPGYLCYTGEMGTYVFRRLKDMFEFFRKAPDRSIDFRYWAEKLQAVDSSSGKGSATEFDKEQFDAVIKTYWVNWVREAHSDGSLDKEQRRELWKAIQDEVRGGYFNDGEYALYQRANDFVWRAAPHCHAYTFTDLWDHRFEKHTDHFLWCCYALAWGINLYDETKS